MKYVYIDEPVGENLFVVGGISTKSQQDILLAYGQFKKQILRVPMTRRQKEAVTYEFKSTLLERTYPQIKRKMLYKLNAIDCKVVYACMSYEGKLFQEPKETGYVAMLSKIVQAEEDDLTIVTFDSFGNAKFENKIIESISSLSNVYSIKQDYSFNNKGLQFADNVCGVIRKHLAGSDPDRYYEIIKTKVHKL